MADIDYTSIEAQYARIRSAYLVELAALLESHLKHFVVYSRVDRITCRVKSVDSFMDKAKKRNDDGTPKYVEPLRQIQDQIGARIVTFYKSDIPHIQEIIDETYARIEIRLLVPEKVNEFGYEGFHYVLAIPHELRPHSAVGDEIPLFFELQIKTLFQHAWAQAEHEITYKPGFPWTDEHKRKVAFTAAQAWGADMIFDELYKEQESRS